MHEHHYNYSRSNFDTSLFPRSQCTDWSAGRRGRGVQGNHGTEKEGQEVQESKQRPQAKENQLLTIINFMNCT